MRGILRPGGFHGEGRKAPFFEGWYLKLVDRRRERSLALIPGYFRGREPGSDHAFIQVVRPGQAEADYLRFSLNSFRADKDRFSCAIGDSTFSDSGLRLQHPRLGGEVRFSALVPWPVRLASPGVMGWYAWMPFMQCYHGVLSLDHGLEGQVVVDGREFDFDGGHGYIEKDWGRSFPKRWIWMQSNSFDEEGTSLSISVANVPWLGYAFPGFLVGLWRQGRLHRWTTYTGARIEQIEALDTGLRLVVKDRKSRLEVTAEGGEPVKLFCPSTDNMNGTVEERLGAVLQVKLTTPDGSLLLRGHQAAYETQGDPRQLTRRSIFS